MHGWNIYRIEESDQTSSNIRASSISGSTLNTDKDKKHFNEVRNTKHRIH